MEQALASQRPHPVTHAAKGVRSTPGSPSVAVHTGALALQPHEGPTFLGSTARLARAGTCQPAQRGRACVHRPGLWDIRRSRHSHRWCSPRLHTMPHSVTDMLARCVVHPCCASTMSQVTPTSSRRQGRSTASMQSKTGRSTGRGTLAVTGLLFSRTRLLACEP